MTTQISILIPTHNRRELLLRSTLASLRQITVPANIAVEVIVVANACTDDTQAAVDAVATTMPFPTRCVAEPQVGLGHARNRCVTEARGQILVLLDDDVWLDPAWLTALLAVYEKFPADLVGGRVDLWWEAVQPPPWFNHHYEWILSGCRCGDQVFESKNGEGLIGANFSFRRAVLDKIGPFNVNLDRVGQQLLGGGESEFIARAMRAGFHAYHAPAAAVKHWVAPHRIGEKYLTGVMAGYTQARIYVKPVFGPTTVIRALVGHGWLMLRHQIGLIAARIKGDRAAALHHRVYRAAGKGGLIGTWRRLCGRVTT